MPKVPVIIGDQEDEGTLFSLFQLNITTNAQLIDYLTPFFPANPNARQAVTGLLAQYPDQPFLGQPANSPFRTGGLNSLYPQYKRIAAVLGDVSVLRGVIRRTHNSDDPSDHLQSLTKSVLGLHHQERRPGVDLSLDLLIR